jgi:hypothetical protein
VDTVTIFLKQRNMSIEYFYSMVPPLVVGLEDEQHVEVGTIGEEVEGKKIVHLLNIFIG